MHSPRTSHSWTDADIGDQAGRTVLVTGANSGLGQRTAEVLARRGATVLLACRSAERGRRALAAVEAVATTRPRLLPCDLADLRSVRRTAERARELTGDRIDVLVNNAGVMAPPKATTTDGFEAQFGINHLGHAALTWLLLPALRRSDSARIVTVASLLGHVGRISLDDPNFVRRRYNPASAYAQSKLANLVFARELHRRLAGTSVSSVAAHPGYSATGLVATMARSYPPSVRRVVVPATRVADLVGQSVRMGALPQLYAATAADVESGDYIGPRGPGGLRGHPAPARWPRRALDPRTGARLWELTADLTGITPDPA